MELGELIFSIVREFLQSLLQIIHMKSSHLLVAKLALKLAQAKEEEVS
jgi:hypothetical protein